MQQELFQANPPTRRNPRRGTRRFMGSTAAAAVSRWMKKRLKLNNPNEYEGAFNSILFGDRHKKVIDLGRTQRGVLRDLVMAYADDLLQLVMGQIKALDDGELLDRLSVRARDSAMTKYATELTKQKLWRQEAPLLDKAEKIMLGQRHNPAKKDAEHPIEVTQHYRSLPSRGNPTWIGQTILKQLGDQRFAVMTGAKNFILEARGLSFSIPKNKSRANRVSIELQGNDLYRVTFGIYRKLEFKPLDVFEDIYNMQLAGLFENYTGLYTEDYTRNPPS